LHAPITATAAPERLTSCRHWAEAKTKGSDGPAATICDLRKCYAHHTRKPDAVDTASMSTAERSTRKLSAALAVVELLEKVHRNRAFGRIVLLLLTAMTPRDC
jgi:hypothetical protein